MPQYTTTMEGVICIFEDKELVGIVRKNGESIFYKTDKMGFEEIAHLLGTNVVKQ